MIQVVAGVIEAFDRGADTVGPKGCHVSNEKKPGCLLYIRDYTTQFYRDYIINHCKNPY